jgi:Icc-related predicted phosphoesterase
MKLLITADLHFRIHWFRWLIEQAPDVDLICIAGDLLDLFKSETRLEQARETTRLVRELAMLFRSQFAPAIMTMLADSFPMIGRRSTGGSSNWIRIRTSSPMVQRENLILTTVPYHCSRQEKSIWLDRGSTIRRQTGKPWIVLHHVPPKTTLSASGEESEA